MVDREIVTPFGLDSSGRIAVTTNPSVRSRQAMLAYLVTSPGERVMRPEWGTPLKDSVFDTFGPVETELLTTTVAESVARDVQTARLSSLSLADVSEDGTLSVAVEFVMVVGDAETTSETAAIRIGGGG